MDFKGLTSFSIGGTIILMVFWNLMAHVQILQFGYNINFLMVIIMQNGILSLIGFLLVGYGLHLIFRNREVEN